MWATLVSFKVNLISYSLKVRKYSEKKSKSTDYNLQFASDLRFFWVKPQLKQKPQKETNVFRFSLRNTFRLHRLEQTCNSKSFCKYRKSLSKTESHENNLVCHSSFGSSEITCWLFSDWFSALTTLTQLRNKVSSLLSPSLLPALLTNFELVCQ